MPTLIAGWKKANHDDPSYNIGSANEVGGGDFSVADLAERNTIVIGVLEVGQTIYVKSDGHYYKNTAVVGGIATWEDVGTKKGSSGGGGHAILKDNTTFAQRNKLRFKGAVTVTDNSTDDATEVEIPTIAGADGKSAYQVWLDAGNAGTVEQYLASLKGATGATLNIRGAWAANTVYAFLDVVTQSGSSYVAPNGFTSGGVFNAANWQLLAASGATTADSSTTVKGLSKLSVAPAVAADPIAAGTNDPRVNNGNELYYQFVLGPDIVNTLANYLVIPGKVASIEIISALSDVDNVDYKPSGTYVWTLLSKATGAATPVSTTVPATWSANLVALGTSDTNSPRFNVQLPSNVLVPVLVTIRVKRYAV